jgi:hypothetical protein
VTAIATRTLTSWTAVRDEIMRKVVSECTRCERTITGVPVLDPDDRSGRPYCSGDCRTSDAEAAFEQSHPSGVAT